VQGDRSSVHKNSDITFSSERENLTEVS